ncbi:MAG: PQQ-dependent sugar dehydrogenase [bacterium]|nr:PQQ-dependent sugar dehydrogenase [bacterium]
MHKTSLSALLLALIVVVGGTARMSAQPQLKTRIVASNLSIPWELVWGPDNRIWITELRGVVSSIDPTSGDKRVLLADLPDRISLNESGLLGMVLHPQFVELPFVYIGYTYMADETIKLKIVRYRYDGSTLVEPTILLGNIQGGFIHNGCRLAFGPDNTLFITAGEGGRSADAQLLDRYNGKILRINADGSIPSDNPIPGSAIWSWGHRNPQGLVFGPNDVLYSSEHGATTDDEVNIITKGRNYGWPRVEGFCDKANELAFCTDSNVVEPIGATWTPTLAVSDLIYYHYDLIPEWKDRLVMCVLKEKLIVVMKLNETRTEFVEEYRMFRGTFGRLRSICASPDGRVFIGSTNKDVYGDSTQHPGCDYIVEITPQSTDVHEQTAHAIFLVTDSQLVAFALSSNATLVITDILGRTINEYNTDQVGGFHVDLSHLASGAYTAIVHTSAGSQAFAFVR